MRKRKILSEDALQNNPISTEEVAVTVADIRRELEAYADPVKREYLPRFFKTGKGQYGEVLQPARHIVPLPAGSMQDGNPSGNANAGSGKTNHDMSAT